MHRCKDAGTLSCSAGTQSSPGTGPVGLLCESSRTVVLVRCDLVRSRATNGYVATEKHDRKYVPFQTCRVACPEGRLLALSKRIARW